MVELNKRIAGTDTRFDADHVNNLQFYEDMFSDRMWQSAVTEFTFWPQDQDSREYRERLRDITDQSKHREWHAEYREHFGLDYEVPSVFIDPMFTIFCCKDSKAQHTDYYRRKALGQTVAIEQFKVKSSADFIKKRLKEQNVV